MKKFSMGEQPQWAGTEPCSLQTPEFIESLLQEDPSESLIHRGYAIVQLSVETSKTYSDFHAVFETFSHLSMEEKQRYATQQFDIATHSPNQFHGFSVVEGLKEQFMMRVCGKGSSLITPGEYLLHGARPVDLGVTGMKLYEHLDGLCRRMGNQVIQALGLGKNVDDLLDPVNEESLEVSRSKGNPLVCSSQYVIPGYISSSIMDNFHYYNSFNKEDHGDERYHNNHSAHTDSGLMTVVVVTDVPGLEVFDQSLKEWIALEQLLHEYCASVGKKHRQYATIFWGDSVDYMHAPSLKPTMHRVGKNQKERYSVVFKQRTSPIRTACRYQEDYALALLQQLALDSNPKVNKGKIKAKWWSIASVSLAVIVVGVCLVTRKR